MGTLLVRTSQVRIHLGGSLNGSTPKCMVYNGKLIKKGDLGACVFWGYEYLKYPEYYTDPLFPRVIRIRPAKGS